MNDVEKLQALCDGKKRVYGKASMQMVDGYLMTKDITTIHAVADYFSHPGSWQIEEPPKRYAKNLQEALEAKEVFITLPEYITKNTTFPEHSVGAFRRCGNWSNRALDSLRLALDPQVNGSVEILED